MRTPTPSAAPWWPTGCFHAAAWVVVVSALVWASRRPSRRSGREVLGAVLVGWGAFHVVDQLLFQLLLQAHQIRPGRYTQLDDWAYTAIGIARAPEGLALVRSRHDRTPARP